MNDLRPILYGVLDYVEMRRENAWYVDRTHCIRELEKTRFAMFLRPRRFGKSLLVSTLQAYYDVNYADRFEELFSGTEIGQDPTLEHGKYFVLYFNFSLVKKEPNMVQESFDEYASGRIDAFANIYGSRLPERLPAAILSAHDCIAKLNLLFNELQGTGHDVYILIDEYDNFTNTILAEHGLENYNDLCHGDGFFKQFFTVLKGLATSTDAPVKRIFITGVFPVTMDDVTSGFNIAVNISRDRPFADWLGFTHADLRRMADYYAPQTGQEADRIYQTCLEWYDNYRFSTGEAPSVANTTLVLSLFSHLVRTHEWPDELVDENLRTDYTKIRHLVTLDGRLNGNFRLLEKIITNGEAPNVSLKRSFQARELTQPDNFLSLLYYFGVLSMAGTRRNLVNLAVPNETLRKFAADYLPSAYRDVHRIDPRVYAILDGMERFADTGMFDGFLSPVCEFVKQIFAVRDAKEGEIAVQSAVVALLTCASGPFLVRHEREANGGYYDIGLAPQLSRWPDIPHAAVIELKYLKAGDPEPDESRLAALRAEAVAQLDRYARDGNLAKAWNLKSGSATPGVPGGTVTLHRIALAFHGGECVLCEEV